MIPSNKWCPVRLQDRAAWYDNFNTHVQVIGSSLGLTPGVLTDLQADNDNMQFLANTATQLEAFTDAVREYRIIMTEGRIGDPTPPFPANPTFALPVAQPTGMFQRLVEAVNIIRASPAYTDEQGALLGIIPSKTDPISPGDLKPVIKATDALAPYTFTVNVTRLGQEAFKVQVSTNGTTWSDAAFGTSNPVTVTITPLTAGEPQRVLVRAILLKKNEPVGEASDPTYVTVNP